MAKRVKSMSAQIRDTIEHSMDVMMGRTPKKALVVDGPMRHPKFMIDGLKYLKRFGPIRHFVLVNGAWFEGRASVKDYPSAVKWRRKHKPQGGKCFQNAREFCLAHPEAKYFEGYYLIFETPEAHGWVVMPDGKVLDFTHEAVIRDLKKEKKEVDVRPPRYLGIEVPHDRLAVIHTAAEPNQPILTLYRKSLKRRRRLITIRASPTTRPGA